MSKLKQVLNVLFILTSMITFKAQADCRDEANLKYDKLGWMMVFGNRVETEEFRFLPNFGEIEEIIIASDDYFSTFDIEDVRAYMSSGREEDLNFFWDKKMKGYQQAYSDDIFGASTFNRVNKVRVRMKNDDFMSKTYDIFASYCDE